jgi:uncharacterized Ntn-hydrolase superfamily protein
MVPHGAGRLGAIATQAFANPFYGIDGVNLLREGCSAAETIANLTASDEGRDHRQLHIVDRNGETACFTGAACLAWSGSVSASQVSVAGNMLAGTEVVEATLAAYLGASALDFDERLLAALDAGERAGGDKRGRQSCAIRIWSEGPVASFDLRVDDHAEPLRELRRLWRLAHQRYAPFQAFLPSRRSPAGMTDREIAYRACDEYAIQWNARHPV